MFTLAHSALFIKQELLADRANRKPAGDGFVYEGNDCRGFPGRPDGYSDWTCPPKRTAAGSCGPFLFGCTCRANRKPAGEASVNEGNDCPRIFWATRRVLGLDMPSQTDRQQEAVGLFFLAAIAPKLPSPPRQHEVGRRGPPMDDALRPVDLYRRPVALHGGDLAAGDAPQQLDISQTHPCEWRTDKHEAVGHFSFLAAIALTEPVASTAARSWPARDAYG